MGKLAEKYKETQFFVKFMELAEDLKKIDMERVTKIVTLSSSLYLSIRTQLLQKLPI